MTPSEASRLIDTAGGNAKFAELLGITGEPGHAQRVSNWRRRGIPADVILANLDVFRRLEKKLSRAA